MMHADRQDIDATNAPQTAGHTLHGASSYELFSNLVGLGANGPNSRMVIELANVQPGDSVLDVACGTGSLTLTAQTYAGRGAKVHGIDAAPEMIATARKKAVRADSDVVFDVGLAEQLAFPDATFDVVISRLAIHHLPDDLKRRAFAEMLRVLKPGGRVLIADLKAPGNHILAHLSSLLIRSHGTETDVWGLPAMLMSAGFVNVTSGPTRSSLLAFVRGEKSAR